MGDVWYKETVGQRSVVSYSPRPNSHLATMKLPISLSLLSLSISTGAAAAGCAPSCPDESLSVKTPYGTYVGTIEPKFQNTRIFKAIPFAQPPTSSLRWLPPQQLPHSNATHYATTYPPSCPQFFSSHPSLWNQYIPIGNQINNGDQNHTSGLVGENTSEGACSSRARSIRSLLTDE